MEEINLITGDIFMTVDELELGEQGKILAFKGKNFSLYKRLMEMGMVKGTIVTMRRKAPLGDPIELSVRGFEIAIRLEDVKEIEIQEVINDGFCTCRKP